MNKGRKRMGEGEMKKVLTTICLLSSVMFTASAHALDLNIANNSGHALLQVDSSSKQMLVWQFPNTISPHSQMTSKIGWKFGFFVDIFGDSGKTVYQTTCADGRKAQIIIRAFMQPGADPIKRYYSQYISVTQQGGSCIALDSSWDVFKDTTAKSSVKLVIYGR